MANGMAEGWKDRTSAIYQDVVNQTSSKLAQANAQAFSNSNPYDTGFYINSGDTAKDAQALANTSIQRAYNDAVAAGINPTWYLTQGGSLSGSSSAAGIQSTSTAKQLKLDEENLKLAAKNAESARIAAIGELLGGAGRAGYSGGKALGLIK